LRISAVSVLFLTGCTAHPRGESYERTLAAQAGAAYAQPFEKRRLPALKPDASPGELVQYALLANGDLEAKYWQWRAALEQVPIEGTQKSGLELSAETMIMDGNSNLEDTTLGIANDAMNSLQIPSKLATDARRALHEAQAAARRFDQARAQLRNQVLAAYYDYALTAELARLEEGSTALLEMTERITTSRLSTGGGSQAELLKIGNELAMSKNSVTTLRAKLPNQRAALNALLSRAPDAELAIPAALPAPRALAADDAAVLALAAKNNPELQALSHEAEANKDAIARAKLEYIPDFNISFTSDLAGMTQTLMGSVVLPYLRHEALDAAIHQAQDNLHATEAMQRQTARSLAARVVSDLVMLREAERQIALFEQDLLPRAQRITEATQTTYGSGGGMMIDVLDAQRSILSLRRMVAEFKVEREKQVADLEEVCRNLPESN
ncbi:MAG TPA: TolC family protein, partial [Phycisphaerae bacterium]|nr:TolC family protein [Phycisphaerae bacterium]